ncbi:MAG: DnaJ C-terminal domain-containing protein [Candidatus Colwellbacteria bacterium]|nr:DnaJ C-terminal domain-containing protein [Candidatus Colwellbacteria bacterium]
MKDYYETLGVSKNASDEEIKKAYRRLAHQYHPDKPGGDESRFKEINEAYQVLSNKSKRAQYDRFGSSFEGAGGNPFGGFTNVNFDFNDIGGMGFGDIFGSIFSDMAQATARPRDQRGSDMELRMEISLEEAVSGKKAPVSVRTRISCDKCAGKGHFPEKGFTKCSKCGGKGEIRETRRTILGSFSQVSVCGECRGSGEIPKSVCSNCKGTGRIIGDRKIDIDIVPGVREGQIIKIKEMGETGERGATSGDLFVVVHIREHSVFERRGDDLLMVKKVPISDIVLGKKIKVKTIKGEEKEIEVPPGASLRGEFRIKGGGATSRGDLVVLLDVSSPKKIDKETKKILEDKGSEW